LVLKPKNVQLKSRKRNIKEDWNFIHRWNLLVAVAAWNLPVCCTLKRGGFLFMSKDVEWKLRQERGVFGDEAEGHAVEVDEEEHEGRFEFQPSEGSGFCSRSLDPPVCCTLKRGGFLFISKYVEWKQRQKRRVFGVNTEGRAVEVEEEEHERRLAFQPSVGSGRCSRSLKHAGVLYTGSRWFSLHFERCGMEGETGAWSLCC